MPERVIIRFFKLLVLAPKCGALLLVERQVKTLTALEFHRTHAAWSANEGVNFIITSCL